MTPGEYRSTGDKYLFLQKIQFDRSYLCHINKKMNMIPEIIEKKKRLFVGLKTNFYGVDSDKNNVGYKLPALWQDFLPRLEEISNTISGFCYGIIQETPKVSDELAYYAVMEVNQILEVPKSMVSIELPSQKYAKFTHKGLAQDLDTTVSYIYSSWLASSEYIYGNEADLEIYGKEFHPTSDESIVYYCLPIK